MKNNFAKAKRNYAIWMAVIFFLLGVVIVRLFWLQIIRGPELEKKRQELLTYEQTLHSPRGRIVDRDGEELAVSIMTGTLYVDPVEMVDKTDNAKDKKTVRDVKRLSADLLAPVLKKKPEELYEIFTSPGRFYYLERMMEPRTEQQVRKIIKDNELPGLHFLSESKRYYTKKRAAAQVLGFVGVDDKGLSGIELQLDDMLRGHEKNRKAFYNALFDELFNPKTEDEKKREEDKLNTVYLTLDSKMQYVLEDSMDDAIARTNARGAAAIIMDPYTGEILGMASRPTFDPNHYYRYTPESWSNKTVSMIYEPGSVFKPIVGVMGLTEGIITPETGFIDNGHIRIADRVIQNWDGSGMGPVSFTTIIKYSINTGMVQLGMQLGAKRMINYSKKFGFGEPTGIDLPGEESGILYRAEDMYEPDIATMAIGQGIAVTPLQELRAICAIANGGELLEPYIVKKIVGPNGEIIKENQKKVVRNVFTEQVATQMRGMMEKVVSEGGGKTAAIKGYKIAGKTGTAEKLAPGGGYAPGQYIASFVGFVPSDKPRYAMLVMLDTPQGAFYGSQVSAPIFRDTLQQILVAKGIQPSTSEGLPSFEQMHILGDKAARKQKAKKIPEIVVQPDGKLKLPEFKGIDMRMAAELLEKANLRLKPYGSGEAYQQKPIEGTVVEPGSTVEVWFN